MERERERDLTKARVSDFDCVVVRDDVDNVGDGRRDAEGTRERERDFLSCWGSSLGDTFLEVDALDESSENKELGKTLERRRAQASGSWVLNLEILELVKKKK